MQGGVGPGQLLQLHVERRQALRRLRRFQAQAFPLARQVVDLCLEADRIVLEVRRAGLKAIFLTNRGFP